MSPGLLTRRLIGVVALAAFRIHAAQATPADQTSAKPQPAVEAQLDARFKTLIEQVWGLYTAYMPLGIDERGRNISDDLRQYILPPQVMGKLQSLSRQGAVRTGAQEAAGKEATQEADRILTEQASQLDFISTYWWRWQMVINHRALWSRLAQRCPQDLSKNAAVRLRTLTDAFIHNMTPASFDQTRLTEAFEALARAFNEERQAVAACTSEADTKSGKPLPRRDRQRPCPAAAPSTSGALTPRLIKRVSPAELYPQSERRSEVEGLITVRLGIDAKGCMRRAEILVSSGSPQLDDAALDGSELLEYLPAEKDGHAVGAYARLQWVFRLE